MLQGDCLLPAFDVVGLGLAVDLLEFSVVGREPGAFHLPGDEVPGHGDDSDIVARGCLDGDDVAALEGQVVDILVERPAGVLEAHLDDVAGLVDGIVLEPGRFVEFETAFAERGFGFGAAVAEGAAAAHFGLAVAVMLFFGIHCRV